MPDPKRFQRGDCVLYRETDGDCLIDVKPVTVVEDSEARLALWLPIGTPTKRPVLLNHVPGTPRRWRDGEWQLVDSTWQLGDALILVRPGELRATWVMWRPDGAFAGWYVNLQSALRRTPWGFDFSDYQLDLVVGPDRAWRLKDEAELAIAIEDGKIGPALAEEIREEMRRAIDAIESAAAPFSEEWEGWRPEADWRRPAMVKGWDDVSMYG